MQERSKVVFIKEEEKNFSLEKKANSTAKNGGNDSGKNMWN